MTDKNEDIHVFIVEEERRRNREQALREMALREKLQEPSEELVKALEDPTAVVENVDAESCWMKPVEVDSLGFWIDVHAVATAVAVFGCAVISAVVVLWLNVVVTRGFPAFGFRFAPEWATSYRMFIGIALGMLGLTAVAELFQIYVLMRRGREKGVDEEWRTFALPDGSAIRVKTLVREVVRLNQFGHDGKPIYAVKADNLVEVLEVSETP